MRPSLGISAALALFLSSATSAGAGTKFDRVVLDDQFPGAYQVEVADVDGDGKPDVIAVGGDTCAWYQNPGWTKRIVSGPKQTPGIITSAARDLDGDGKAEIAIGCQFEMNQPSRGKLVLARQGKTLDDPWTFEPVDDVPSIHRLRWGDLDGDGAPDLVAAPIFGPSARPPAFQDEPAHVVVYRSLGQIDPRRWQRFRLGDAPVLHAIEVTPPDPSDHRSRLLAACNQGVLSFHVSGSGPRISGESMLVARGASGTAPKIGSSEVHEGRLGARARFLATVDPWHGSEVAVRYYEEPGTDNLMYERRQVIDSTLRDGHALWVVDVDRDGDDEIFVGHRGPGTSVLMYDYHGKTWDRTVVDDQIAAQDLRGGDLDADGIPDVVAVGGSTHNVVWYRPRPPAR